METVLRHAPLPILIALLLVCGCVLLHPTDPYAGMQARRASPGSACRPDSSRPASSRPASSRPIEGPLSLDEAICIALANNPELAAAAHEADAAMAGFDAAFGERLPSLYAEGGYTRYLNDQRLIPVDGIAEPAVFSRNVASGDLVLRMPLFAGGGITSRIEAADLLRQSAGHRLARSREELIFNVSSVFYGILARRRVIESLDFSKKTLEEHLKRVRDLLSVRKAAKVDRLRSEVRIADLDQRIVREQNVLAVQKRVLTSLLGLDLSGEAVEPEGELLLTRTFIPDAGEAVETALASRADYRAARSELESRARAVDAARAGYWPTLSLFGSYGGRWAFDPSAEPAGTDNPEDVGRIGVLVDIPLFAGGSIEASVRQERARLLASRERLRKLELRVRLEVETAILNIDASTRRVEAMEKAIEQAKESLRIEREKYDLGKGAIVDVLDAQSALLESQTNYHRALADYNIALVQLRWAVGES